MTIKGKSPASPVTPAGAGIQYGSNGYIVTAPQADQFGTMSVETLRVTDGSGNYWNLLQNGSWSTGTGGGGTGGSGSGVTYNIIRYTNPNATIYFHPQASPTPRNGVMQVYQWYVYIETTTNSHGPWYLLSQTCTYNNGRVTPNASLSNFGWVNLDSTLSTVEVRTNQPGA